VIAIRPARAADRESVRPLAVALATSTEPTRAQFDSTFDDLLAAPERILLIAEADDRRVVGYAMAFAHRAFHSDGPLVWVEEVIVDPDQRGHGIGRALMTAVEAWARNEIEATYIALATRRASPFYEALGYEASATYFKRVL
jgi:GNAT superfamily N-acetyltransferase